MTAIAPLFLYGLLGILIPVIIHLWSKKNRTPVPFSSIRFIQTSTQRSLRRIIPTDFWMFILRVLTILFLVALLADIRIPTFTEANARTYFVDSIYVNDTQAMERIRLLADSAEVSWLPIVPAEAKISLWKSKATPGDVIISPLTLQTATLDKDALLGLNLQSWPLQEAKEQLIGIGQLNGTKIALKGSFDEQSTRLTYRSNTNEKITSLKYYLFSNQDYQPIKKIIQSALTTINDKGLYLLEKVEKQDEADVIFWLSDQAMPILKAQLVSIRRQVENWNPVDDKTAYISSQLSKESAVQSGLVNKLYQWLSPYNHTINQLDQRISQQLTALTMGQELEEDFQYQDLKILWWLLLCTCIGIERWIAIKR